MRTVEGPAGGKPGDPGGGHGPASQPLAAELGRLNARFDHVAMAATSFDLLLPLYRDALGGSVVRMTENVALGFQAMHVAYAEGTYVELLQPSPGSPFLSRFLEHTGGRGAVHHVNFRVDDVAAAVSLLNAAGYGTFGERLDDPAHCEAFVHPRDAHGVLVQVASINEDAPAGAAATRERWRPLDRT